MDLPHLHPRPFLWVWYLLNGITPPAPLQYLQEMLQAYRYLHLFGFSDLKPWWDLMVDKQLIFPDYLSLESSSYREELLSILSRTNANYLPLPTHHLTGLDKNYLGLYPPQERENVAIPSLSFLKMLPNIDQANGPIVVVVGIAGDTPHIEEGKIETVSHGGLLDRVNMSSAVHEELIRILGSKQTMQILSIPGKVLVRIGTGTFSIAEDVLIREQSSLTFYETPQSGSIFEEAVFIRRRYQLIPRQARHIFLGAGAQRLLRNHNRNALLSLLWG